MKKTVASMLVSLLATIATPLVADAQQRVASRPNSCGWIEGVQERVCLFQSAEQNTPVLYLLLDSIHTVSGSNGGVDFTYMTADSRIRNEARVTCQARLDHWHRFNDDFNIETIPVASFADRRMLNYVCERAGQTVKKR